MTDYLVRPSSSDHWHHAHPCVAINNSRQPVLHWANAEGQIICSALDEHDVIEYRPDDNKSPVVFHQISAADHFSTGD